MLFNSLNTNMLLVLMSCSLVSGCLEVDAPLDQQTILKPLDQQTILESLETLTNIKIDPYTLNQIINFDSFVSRNPKKPVKHTRLPGLLQTDFSANWQLKGTFIMKQFQIAWLEMESNRVYGFSVGDKLPGLPWIVSRIFSDRIELSALNDCPVSLDCEDRLHIAMSNRLY